MAHNENGNGNYGQEKVIALETRERDEDARQFSPSAARNRAPILDELRKALPQGERGSVKVLEIASGTGEHAVHFTKALEQVLWQPSDLDPLARASIAAWAAHEKLSRILPPVTIDAAAKEWGVEKDAPFDMVISMNMIHISPWGSCEGLVSGAARVLKPGGKLFLYGPFSRAGVHTAPSNEEFDRSLKARNREWGVRDLDDVSALSDKNGLSLSQVIEMPANNYCVLFEMT